MNALGLEYEYIRVNPIAGETQTAEYLKMHPAGKVPAINDDGFMMFESNAIMKYLCRKHDSSYYPDDTQAQARVDQWLDFVSIHLANGVTRVMFNKIVAELFGMDKDERSMEEGYGFIKRFLDVINGQLKTSTHLAGEDLTIADFCMLGTLDPCEVIEVDLKEYPQVNAWRSRLMQETFYQNMHASYAETLAMFKKMIE